MDLHGKLEIYIPKKAEVKSIPLCSLPDPVLRRMGLPLSDYEGFRMHTDSPEGIWICPAVVRKKGQIKASHTGNDVVENMSSLLDREFQALPGPNQMYMVCANRTAYKVLKDTMSEKSVSLHTSHTSLIPRGSPPQNYKAAVVIYHGCIYLATAKSNRSQSQRKTREPQPESQSSIPSTSASSSKIPNKRPSPQVSLEPANEELQRKKLRATLPQTSPEQLKDGLTKADDYSTTDQELLNENRPKEKRTTCKVTHSENKDVMHKKSGASSSVAAHSVPQSTDRVLQVHSHCHMDSDGERAAEEAGGTAWFQPHGEQEEVASNDGGECDDQDLGDEEADYIQVSSGESDDSVSFVEESSNHSWTRRESEGLASASTSQREFDFKALADEEKISQMMAKLRRSEAALNSLHAS